MMAESLEVKRLSFWASFAGRLLLVYLEKLEVSRQT